MLTNLVKKLPTKSIHALKNNIHLAIAFAVLIIASALSSFWTPSQGAQTQQSSIEVDTIIPKGYVLIPLSLQNHESISSVIQSYGIIDLYSGNPEGLAARKIASRIKLIRAPYNPNLFAALVKEQLSEYIMKQSGSFFAVIQNKTETEGRNEIPSFQTRKSIQIEYQGN